MNKAEIIKKISKKAGVPDTEAKKFFEIFLKDASDLLKPGESLKIPKVGMFQLRIGQIENSTTQTAEDKFIYSDIIVFIDEKDDEPEDSKEIIFNVPSGIYEQYHPVDSFFSLSIGKPIIPLKGIKGTEFFIPPSGNELRGLIESKVEKLMEESEKVGGGKETETIYFRTEEESTEESFKWEKVWGEKNPVETEVPSRSDFLKTREFENLSWDFGENLSEEIKEGFSSDSEREQEEIKPGEAAEVKENGNIPEEQPDTPPLFEEEAVSEEAGDKIIFEDIIDVETEEEEIFEDVNKEASEKIPETETKDEQDEITDQPFETLQPGDEEIKDTGIEEEQRDNQKRETEEPVLKNFQRVTSLTKEFKSSQFEDTEETEEERPKKITEVRGGYQKVRRTTAEFNFDLSDIKGLDEIDEEPPPEEKKSIRREYPGYRKRSNLPSLIIAFVVVLALGVVIFLYMKVKIANDEAVSANQPNGAKQETTVIDRNYDVPVTYPYKKPGSESTSGVKKNIKEPTAGEENPVKTAAPVEKKEEDLSEIREPANAERIGNYIYQYPGGVVVQVSSWKNRSIAIKEVRKYRNAGYSSFAEPSTIPGMGLYYRVRVGYFKSLKEAENFLNRK